MFRTSGGISEDGIVVGNAYDKYASRNPIVRWLMAGFESSLLGLVDKVDPESIHEIGCGEGYWVLRWKEQGHDARGCDFSSQVIDLARQNARNRGCQADLFHVGSIYDLQAGRDEADLIVCCEVLEHLEDPREGLAALRRVVKGHLILSVPREPLWCLLNMARGKYLSSLGNTPGHFQHWSQRAFIELAREYFEVVEVRSPLPWTMLLCQPRK